MKYVVFIFQDEYGEFVANAPDIPECIARRDNLDELHEVIVDVAELCLEDEDLPIANTNDHFAEDVLDGLSIPLSCSKHTLNVTEDDDDDKSYEVELILA